METVSLTLKNYRSFADTNPVRLDLGPGFTALVGPNNSGKSSLLKFLHEMKNLWANLPNPNFLSGLNGDSERYMVSGPLPHVVDLHDLTCDYTGRPLEIEIEFPRTKAPQYLSRLHLIAAPGDPTRFRGNVFYGPQGQQVTYNAGRFESLEQMPIDMSDLTELCSVLRDAMYLPPFRNAINEGGGSYFDLAVGTALVGTWNQWKAGESRAAKQAVQQITDDICGIFGFDSLEINASSSGTTLDLRVDGKPYRLNDVGSGITQFIIIFANVAIRRPSLILIDEPELNLHPSLQIDFLTSLATYSKTNSLLFATHSIGLARATGDRIYSFRKSAGGALVQPFEQTANYAEFAGEMSFSAFRELGSSALLLVEGASDVRTIQQFLRILGLDHQIVVIHLGGAAMITSGREHELEELKRLSDNVAVLIDSERISEKAKLERRRKRFIEDCKALGFATHLTERRALENYLTERAVKQVKGDRYRGLGEFELLRELPLGWGKHENWRIARIMTSAELEATDVGEFLAGLGESPNQRPEVGPGAHEVNHGDHMDNSGTSQ